MTTGKFVPAFSNLSPQRVIVPTGATLNQSIVAATAAAAAATATAAACRLQVAGIVH